MSDPLDPFRLSAANPSGPETKRELIDTVQQYLDDTIAKHFDNLACIMVVCGVVESDSLIMKSCCAGDHDALRVLAAGLAMSIFNNTYFDP